MWVNLNNKNVVLNSFPSSYSEALVILYLQNQDLIEKSPAEIYELYYKAEMEIRNIRKERKAEIWKAEIAYTHKQKTKPENLTLSEAIDKYIENKKIYCHR